MFDWILVQNILCDKSQNIFKKLFIIIWECEKQLKNNVKETIIYYIGLLLEINLM